MAVAAGSVIKMRFKKNPNYALKKKTAARYKDLTKHSYIYISTARYLKTKNMYLLVSPYLLAPSL